MPRTLSLRSFFEFLERRGGGTFSRQDVERELGDGTEGAEILRALMRAEIVTKARYAVRLACPEGRTDCEGIGVEQHFEARRETLHGVCTARRRRCPSFEIVDEAPLARVTVTLSEIGKSLRRIFELDGVCALEERYVLTLGEEEIAGQNPRDVLFLPCPDHTSLAEFVSNLERTFRATLLFLPTRRTELRGSLPETSRVEVRFLSELLVVRDGRIALGAQEATVAPPSPVATPPMSSATAPLTLVLECARRKRGMVFSANGVNVDLPDAKFALLIKLVDLHLRDRNAWATFRSLGLTRGATWRTNQFFAGVAPAGFEVIQIDRKKQCTLNPAVVIARVDWRSVAAHPDKEVKGIAERHLAAAETAQPVG